MDGRPAILHSRAMANIETAAEPRQRKRPAKSVLIRLAIYLPLLGFFGWQAVDRAIAEREAANDAFRQDMQTWLESPPGLLELTHGISLGTDAMLSAPPETGDETTGSTSETGTTSDIGSTGDETAGSTSDTGTTSDTGDTSSTGSTGEPATTSSTSTTTTGTSP